MTPEKKKLEQARRARRLAETVDDPQVRQRLLAYAQELEAQADTGEPAASTATPQVQQQQQQVQQQGPEQDGGEKDKE